MKLKRIFTIFSILCVIIFFVDSQEKILKFFGNNGILATYPIAEIDSIKVGATDANEKSLKIHRGNELSELSVANIDSVKIEEEIDPSQIPDNEIWYRTADNQIYDIYQCTKTYGHQPFDASIVSHTYENGIGVIKFDAPVTKINDHTFGNGWAASMTELYLPDCIEYLGTGSIANTQLKTFRVPSNLKIIESYGISENHNLESFIGSHVTDDGRCIVIDGTLYSFAPKGVADYSIPANVVYIAPYAFRDCNLLNNITFSEGLKGIFASAFMNCTGLNSVTLPNSLERLDSPAFGGCPNIQGFYGNDKFHSPDNRCLYYIPSSFETSLDPSTQSGPYVVYFAGGDMEEYTIPEGVVGINGVGFNMAKNLKRLTLPNSLTCANSLAFEGCDKLEAIYGKHTSIDNKCIVINNSLYAYVAHDGVRNYTIPNNITSIQSRVFSCVSSSLEHVYMSDQVTEIADYAFAFCDNLKSVTLSASLYKIGINMGAVVGPDYNPFLGSDNLESIYFRSQVPPIYGDTQMSDWDKLTVYVPKGCLDTYKKSGWAPFSKFMTEYEYTDLPFDYISSDYSQDGIVTTLQTASVGEGIDIVLMGDAYSDRQIADGTYAKDMKYIYDNLFTEEPYKSFKDHFNVHYVNVVSATEGYEYGNTALDSYFGEGTFVGGNDNAVFTYAQKAISANDMDEALIIVAMNSDNYAGTCYMYYPTYSTGTFGSGVSVAYFPKGGDESTFAQLLHHEACGHGFAKLADEYAYEDMGIVPNDYESQIKEQQSGWGWWKNVDFTSDLNTIRWSHFLNDTRYANEGLGAFEGGLTYWNGVWRPTENSIMRYNTGGFNAPSREAIYYRIHKLAYGDDWQYDYEKFAEWDAKNRTAAANAARMKAKKPANYKPTHPPVIVNKSWKEAK